MKILNGPLKDQKIITDIKAILTPNELTLLYQHMTFTSYEALARYITLYRSFIFLVYFLVLRFFFRRENSVGRFSPPKSFSNRNNILIEALTSRSIHDNLHSLFLQRITL